MSKFIIIIAAVAFTGCGVFEAEDLSPLGDTTPVENIVVQNVKGVDFALWPDPAGGGSLTIDKASEKFGALGQFVGWSNDNNFFASEAHNMSQRGIKYDESNDRLTMILSDTVRVGPNSINLSTFSEGWMKDDVLWRGQGDPNPNEGWEKVVRRDSWLQISQCTARDRELFWRKRENGDFVIGIMAYEQADGTVVISTCPKNASLPDRQLE